MIKPNIIETPLLRHPNLSKVFEVVYDIIEISISNVLSQDVHLVAYFSEKLNKEKQGYSTNKEFYVMCDFFVIGDTIHYQRNLSFTLIMKPLDN